MSVCSIHWWATYIAKPSTVLETLLETLLFLIVLITNHLIYYLSCLHFNVDKPLIKTVLSDIPSEITSVNKLELVS